MPAPRSPVITPDQFTTFGELLKFLRRRAGLTQRELSIALGYSTSQISRLEHNARPPDAASLAARFVPALQLGTEPDWAARLLELAAISRAAVQPFENDHVTPAPTPPHNLPSQLTSFIGREDAIAQGRRLLGASRLVTLTGAGGSGKTRLALQIAAEVLNDFPDGVWLVELAPLADPALLAQTVASVLGVPEQPSRPILDTLAAYLRARTTLLVLDNCEHLISACARVAEDLLKACPNVRLLATSREALDLAGETTLVVPPLSFPAESHPVAVAALRRFDAVRLFVDRAVMALPDFALTPGNAHAVALVCRELDGMPLAIEMAAARVKLLQVEQIAERLTDRFQLLTDGRRTALPRHQTLAAVMDWSYDLLSEPERVLLRRLAVFAGGWALEAAEAVCSDKDEGRRTPHLVVGAGVKDEIKPNGSIHPSREAFTPAHDAGAWVIHPSDVLDLLTGLVNKSLVVVTRKSGQETRYSCLETLRQYALAKLAASDDEDATRRRHARHYCVVAETAWPLLRTSDRRLWLDRVEADLDNFRAALAWNQTTAGDAEEGLRLATALTDFWGSYGLLSEGRAWMAGALARGDAVTPRVRVLAIQWASGLAYYSGDNDSARRYCEEGLQVSRAIGYTLGIGHSLRGLGAVAYARRDDDTALAMMTESLALFRQLGDKLGIADGLDWLGMLKMAQGDYRSARAQFAESLELYQQLGDARSTAALTVEMGHVAWSQGDEAQAEVFYDQALALFRELGAWPAMTEAYFGQARVARQKGDVARAKTLLLEALVTCRDFDDKLFLPYCLAGMGGLATTQGQPDTAAMLLGAAAALWDAAGKRLGVRRQAEYDRDVTDAREQLGEAAFAAAWAEGRAMTPEQAIELALRT